jgi:transposase
MLATIGIDVSKKKFDVTLLSAEGKKKRKTCSNNTVGIKAFVVWLKKNGIEEARVCMEATSVYWEEVAEKLTAEGYLVSVVNPMRIKGFAMSKLNRNKTDALDADVIAEFCRSNQDLTSWHPPTPVEKKLRDLDRHRQDLVNTRTAYTNRLHVTRDESIRQRLQKLIDLLNTEIKEIERQIDDLIKQDKELQEKFTLLCSIKGIAEITARHFLAEMYDLEHYESATAAAADVGLTPSHYQSGSSVRRRSKMSRMGKKSLRAALYLPAQTAMCHNPVIKKFVKRLQAKSKLPKVIKVAVMRKLVHLAYGVLKNRQSFDPNYGSS